jgi:hypothetical protein
VSTAASVVTLGGGDVLPVVAATDPKESIQ